MLQTVHQKPQRHRASSPVLPLDFRCAGRRVRLIAGWVQSEMPRFEREFPSSPETEAALEEPGGVLSVS
jgi:hypothetical protein